MYINSPKKYWQLLRTLVHYFKHYKKYKKEYFKVLEKYYRALPNDNEYRYKLETWNRVVQSVVFSYPVIESFSLLHGRGTTVKEREKVILLCAVTPMVDDLIDEYRYPIEKSISLTRGQNIPFVDLDSVEKVVYKMVWDIIDQCRSRQRFEEAGEGIVKAMYQGTDDRFDKMLNMGGWTCKLAETILDSPFTEKEIEAVYRLGGILQFVDDIFDYGQDLVDGKKTYSAGIQTASDLEKAFDDFVQDLYQRSEKLLSDSKSTKFHTTSFIHLLHCTGKFGLKQYKKIEQKEGVEIQKIESKKLVVDMEKNSSKLALLSSIFFSKIGS